MIWNRGRILYLLVPLITCGWTTPINISNTDSMSTSPMIIMDRRGYLHCVWDDRTPGNYDIFYTFYNGTTWAEPQNISSDSHTSWGPDVGVDTMNRIHIAWGDNTTGEIMWSMFEGDTWRTPVAISLTGFCESPRLAVDYLNNEVHCVWHDLSGGDIWHAFFNGDTWSIPEDVSNDSAVSAWPDIAIDSLGRVHVVWMDYETYDIFYSQFDGDSWSASENISNLSGQSCAPRIDIDSGNNPWVVWEERSSGYNIYYTYFDGAGWVSPVLVETIDAQEPDIDVGRDGMVHMVYSYDYEIYHVVYRDTIQVLQPEDISNTGHSLLPCICVDSLYAHVVWQDGSMDSSTPAKRSDIFYVMGIVSGVGMEVGMDFYYSPVVVSSIEVGFSLKESINGDITIYDITGRKVEEIFLGRLMKGFHRYKVSLDIKSGVYFFQIQAGEQRRTGRFVLITP